MIIGFGTGTTTNVKAATWPGVVQVDTIEIEISRYCALRTFLRPLNGSVLTNPRSHIIVADARTVFFATSEPETYDVIISEPSNPWLAGVGYLYTGRSFTRQARRRIGAGRDYLTQAGCKAINYCRRTWPWFAAPWPDLSP